ncbi:MAG: phosphatidic acid phosphatase [Clostridia bacterium]|nr:phosphatidic acid phosphatase [Clostridia bacterium]
MEKRTSLRKMLTGEYRHLLMLIYWPVFGLIFWTMELMPGRIYHPVESVLDSMIPFCEWFAIPYFFWFIYIIGSIVYFFFKDKTAYIKYMWFVIITYTITLIVYAIYPTSQLLRPEITEDGILFDVIRWLYGYDTNTNVCPSLHVIGSIAVMFAAVKCNSIKSRWIKVIYVITAVAICASIVFIKQHSIIDLFWGVIVSLVAYPVVFADNKISIRLTQMFAVNRNQRCHKETLIKN